MNIDNFYKYECNIVKYLIIYLFIIVGLFINLIFYLYYFY